ncbi:MAG: Gfo/Idh/MocA family oxidoreductase [Pirellulaceae bacterium]|nr:Gfo/Idh/MocA family oxidoreductase [Pirellulaceae bacterium]
MSMINRLAVMLLFGVTTNLSAAEELRIGMIGLDTSHVIAFTKAFNDPEATGDLAEMRVVAGFPGGTDIPPSRDRVAGFTQQLKEMGIEIVDSIPDLLSKVDVVLLESVDGRPHLEQARLVIEAGKPLFIDKPVAGSLKDAVAIFRLAEKHDVPCFSSSSLRYVPEAIAYRNEKMAERVNGCVVWGPCSIQPPMPDLFFYGVHGVEMLYTIMGTGCVSVTRSSTESTDVVTGVWQDGRIGTYRGLRSGKKSFGAVVFETDRIALIERSVGYQPLLDQIARFFKSGKAPVAAAETIEIFAFMEAADESKRLGGKPVQINP